MIVKKGYICIPKYMPTTLKIENGCIYKGAKLYNNLPCEIKNVTKNKFNKFLKVYLEEREVWNSLD